MGEGHSRQWTYCTTTLIHLAIVSLYLLKERGFCFVFCEDFHCFFVFLIHFQMINNFMQGIGGKKQKTGYDQTMKMTGVIFYQVSTFRALTAPSSLLWTLSFMPRVGSTGRSCSHLRPLLKQVHLIYSMYMYGPNPLFIYSRRRDAGVVAQEVEGLKEDAVTFKTDTNDRLSC